MTRLIRRMGLFKGKRGVVTKEDLVAGCDIDETQVYMVLGE